MVGEMVDYRKVPKAMLDKAVEAYMRHPGEQPGLIAALRVVGLIAPAEPGPAGRALTSEDHKRLAIAQKAYRHGYFGVPGSMFYALEAVLDSGAVFGTVSEVTAGQPGAVALARQAHLAWAGAKQAANKLWALSERIHGDLVAGECPDVSVMELATELDRWLTRLATLQQVKEDQQS
jgi:hypothetical protein